QEQGLKVVLARHLSVRETERWVHDYNPAPPARRPSVVAVPSPDGDDDDAELIEPRGPDFEPELGRGLCPAAPGGAVRQVTLPLEAGFGGGASVSGSRLEGRVVLRYSSAEELDELLAVLLG